MKDNVYERKILYILNVYICLKYFCQLLRVQEHINDLETNRQTKSHKTVHFKFMGFYFTIALDNKIKSSGIYLANKYFTKIVMFLNNEPLECSK